MPPESGSFHTKWEWVNQFPAALRERYAVTTDNCNLNYPVSTFVWATGQVVDIVDNEDGTLQINCLDSEGDPVDWIDAATIKRWDNFSGEYNTVELPYAPAYYKVAIYPVDLDPDDMGGPLPADPSLGHTLEIDTNGETWLQVVDDGVLFLNGKTLANYAGYRYEIIRSGASKAEQYGYSWIQRYPPRPNDLTYKWGYTGKVAEVEVTDEEDWTITVGGQTTPALAIDITAADLEEALIDLTSLAEGQVRVSGTAPDFTIVFAAGLGGIATSANGATITTPANKIGDTTQEFPASLIGKDIVFQVQPKWVRAEVTAVAGNVLTFNGSTYTPTVNSYFAAIETDGYWRPHFYAAGHFPQFRVETIDRITRSGIKPVWEVGNYWSPQSWYTSLARTSTPSHNPNDEVADYGVPALTVYVEECFDEICVCEEAGEDVEAFDVVGGLTATPVNYCTEYADLQFQPWELWTLRGWQLQAEALSGFFIEPKDYSSDAAIPNFTVATWVKYANVANTQTATISSVTSGVAAFSAITLPTITPLGGSYSTLSDVWYAVINADGSIESSGQGTTTSTTFTKLFGGFTDPTDVGKTLVIAFGWTRKYERQIRHLYKRTVFIPEANQDAEDMLPPSEEYPGEYTSAEPSTTYAEYSKQGKLDDNATAFITGESARYVAEHWEAVSNKEGYEDLLFMGVPAATSDFPSWTYTGTAGDGGNFWLEDTDNLFWVSPTPLVVHEGTGTSGSTTTILKDANAYGDFETHTDPETTELQTRLSRYWQSDSGQRFVSYILEVAVSGDGTELDPYVWERRPITAQNISTASNPYVTVSPAFSSTTLSRPYKIREGGFFAGRGTIKNTFVGRPLVITHADGSTETVTITHSDDTRLYWSTAESVTAEAGDHYRIDEVEAGSVLQYKPATAHSHNGWVRPEQATQDTRGHDWFVGSIGPLQNLPTIVNNVGRLRKGDIITYQYFVEMYNGIDALRWIKKDVTWSSRLDPETPEINRRHFLDTGTSEGHTCANTVEYGELGFTTIYFEGEDAYPPAVYTYMQLASQDGFSGNWDVGVLRRYAYAVISGIPTCFNHEVEVWGVGLVPTFGFAESGNPEYNTFDDTYPPIGASATRNVGVVNGQGDGFAAGVWEKIVDVAATNDPEQRVRVGTNDLTTMPTWGECPDVEVPTPNGNDNIQSFVMFGYVVGEKAAIIKFDCTGGFNLVT